MTTIVASIDLGKDCLFLPVEGADYSAGNDHNGYRKIDVLLPQH
ncbi:MAG: hypothetical protein OXD38_07645 [Aestuariivita sp.]|nr:hypothetical protein [Aestuariivita sp.]